MRTECVLVVGWFVVAGLGVAGFAATQVAGRCPDCGFPTLYTTDKRSHVCAISGRTCRLGKHGETRGGGGRPMPLYQNSRRQRRDTNRVRLTTVLKTIVGDVQEMERFMRFASHSAPLAAAPLHH